LSLIEKSVESLQKVDATKSFGDAIYEFIHADGALETSAALAKVTAEVALGVAVSNGVRTACSSLRLGLAVSGRIGEWEALSKVLGVASGVGAGGVIDAINQQNYGSDVWDMLNPDPLTNQYWFEAKTPPRRDPLAIDLDGDGIETIGISDHVVQFDHDGDGTRTGTGWLAADDAWLALDRNGNGHIDSGVELFGVDTPLGAPGAATATDGFHALRALDHNQDGFFNAQDPEFWQVQVWQDANQNGQSDSGELVSLYAKGITQVALQPATGTTDLGNGNSLTGTAQVVRTDGTFTGAGAVNLVAGNLNLADNPFYREFADTIAPTDAAEALPDMRGSGWVRDLREAMSTGSPAGNALANAVAVMASATTRDQQLAAVDAVLQAWAESSGRLTQAQDMRPLSAEVVAQSPSGVTRRYTIAEPGQWAAGHAQFEFPSDTYSTLIQGFGGHSSRVLTDAGAEVVRRMVLLETFNGSRFVDVTRAEGPLPGFAGPAPTAPPAGTPPAWASAAAVAAMRSRTARPSASASAAPPADRAQALQPVRAPARASPTQALSTSARRLPAPPSHGPIPSRAFRSR
jgi:hypothetical protein